MNKFVTLIKDENGANLIEYAVAAMLISLVCIVAVTLLGKSVSNMFVTVGTKVAR